MNCKTARHEMFAGVERNPELRRHLEACADCRAHRESLLALSSALSAWDITPEVSSDFDARLTARVRAAAAARPQVWRALQARIEQFIAAALSALRRHPFPAAALASAVLVIGAFLLMPLFRPPAVAPHPSVVTALQTLDRNADTLESFDLIGPNAAEGTSATATPASSSD
jgi:hypothetical protein